MKTKSALSTRQKEYISWLKSAAHVHVVGVTGAEGLAICRLLTRLGVAFTAHDSTPKKSWYESYKKSHEQQPKKEAAEKLGIFKKY